MPDVLMPDTLKVLITGSLRGQLFNELVRGRPAWAQLCPCEPRLDISDGQAVTDVIDRQRPGIIINAAAYTAVDQAETDGEPAWAVNARGVQHLADGAGRCGAHLLQVSTDFVFGTGHGSPISVDAPTAPLSVYGRTKLAGERAVLDTVPDSGLVVRTAWVYASHGENFLRTMLRLMRERSELGIVADQVGTPTSARSLAAALWRAAEKRCIGTLHFTDAGVASWYDFAVAIREEALGLGLLDASAEPLHLALKPLRTSDYPTPATRPAYSVLDTWGSRAALELDPIHWREALRKTLEELVPKASGDEEILENFP